MVKKIQNNNMDEALQAKAAVVDFSAVWCGPCQMLRVGQINLIQIWLVAPHDLLGACVQRKTELIF